MSQITGKLPHPLPEDVILDARLNILCTRKSVRDAIRSKTRELVPYRDPRLWTMVYSPTQQAIQLNPVLYASVIIFRNDGSFDLYALPSREIQQYRIPSRDATWNRVYILYLSCKNLGTFQLLNYWRSGGRFLNMHRMNPCKFPFPLPCCFFCIFFLLFSLIQKERPKWLACMPCQINMGIPVMRAGLALPGRDLSCPRPFAAVLLSMTRLGMWYHSTSLFNFADSLQDTSIYLTINLQIFPMMASSLLRGPESNCRVCTLYAEWGMARFWFTRFTSWHLRFQGLPTTTKLTGDWGDHTETFYTYNQLKCRCCLLFSCTGK